MRHLLTLIKYFILAEFYQDGLQVIISGEVKSTPQVGPCCTENFVITEISR